MTSQAAIQDVLARLDVRLPAGAIVAGGEISSWPPNLRVAVERAGWLRRITPATTVDCDACDGDHAADVFWLSTHPERAYIDCPSVGRVPLDPARLLRWRVDDGGVATWLAGELGVQGAPDSVTPGLWRVGGSRVAGARWATFLAAGGVSADAIRDATKRTRAPLVFCCGAAVDAGVVPMVRLSEIAQLREDHLALDWPLLEEMCGDLPTALAPESVSSTSTGSGRPTGRTMGSMLDCWFTCHNLGGRFDSPHDAYVAIDRYLLHHPPADMDVLSIGRYANARSRAKTRRTKLGYCTWWRCADGPPSALLSA